MKHLLVACSLFGTFLAIGQIPNHSISLSSEIGPGLGYVRDYSTTFQQQFDLPNKKSHGYGVSYEYTHRLYNQQASISMGLGFTTTIFSQRVAYTNLARAGNPEPITHNLTDNSHYFMSIDLPFTYHYSIPVGKSDLLNINLGLKIRNIAYIGDEERNTTVGGGWYNVNGADTAFYMRYEIEYRTLGSRVIFHPNLGLSYSHFFENGSGLTFLCEFNYGLVNAVEFKITDMGNIENNVSYMDLEDRGQRFRVRPTHLRFGISYHWNKKKVVP